MDSLIPVDQNTFIPHRAIQDNIIIAHEVFYYLKISHSLQYFMALKLDMYKAYDQVDWNFLQLVVLKMDFAAQLGTIAHPVQVLHVWYIATHSTCLTLFYNEYCCFFFVEVVEQKSLEWCLCSEFINNSLHWFERSVFAHDNFRLELSRNW